MSCLVSSYYLFLTLDFYYNCSFNARAYFERALVLLGANVGKYIIDWLIDWLKKKQIARSLIVLTLCYEDRFFPRDMDLVWGWRNW